MELNLVDKIKILVHNSLKKSLLDNINFDNDEIFKEPLLFAYFNSKSATISLEEIIQGYFCNLTRIKLTSFNDDGIAYVPNLGYFNKKKEKIESISFLKNTNIEILTHHVEILNDSFVGLDGNLLTKKQYEISKGLVIKFLPYLENAILYIRIFVPYFLHFISKMIFN